MKPAPPVTKWVIPGAAPAPSASVLVGGETVSYSRRCDGASKAGTPVEETEPPQCKLDEAQGRLRAPVCNAFARRPAAAQRFGLQARIAVLLVRDTSPEFPPKSCSEGRLGAFEHGRTGLRFFHATDSLPQRACSR